jgi:hypothetical protein
VPTYIRLSQIVHDARLQNREHGLDESHVHELVEAYKTKASLGPVKAVKNGAEFYVYDGWHRVAARGRNGQETIDAEVINGDLDKAIELAAAANKDHGLKRTNAGKRLAVQRILSLDSWKTKTHREIAAHVGVSHPFVAEIRAASVGNVSNCPTQTQEKHVPATRVGKDGKSYKASKSQSRAAVGTKDSTPAAAPSTNGAHHDDDPPFEPPIDREPGEDDDEPQAIAFPDEWNGAKFNQLIKAVAYLENKVVPAAGIAVKRVLRIYPHHGLPLSRWQNELDSMTRELKRFRQRVESQKKAAK